MIVKHESQGLPVIAQWSTRGRRQFPTMAVSPYVAVVARGGGAFVMAPHQNNNDKICKKILFGPIGASFWCSYLFIIPHAVWTRARNRAERDRGVSPDARAPASGTHGTSHNQRTTKTTGV